MNIIELNNLGLENKKVDNDNFIKNRKKSYDIKKIEQNDNVIISKHSYDKFQQSIEVKKLIVDIKKNEEDSESGKNLSEIKKRVASGFYDDKKILEMVAKKIIKGIKE